MPIRVTEIAGGSIYANPFVGAVEHTDHIKLDISVMTTAEVDADGYLKPGVPLKQNGTLVAATQAVYGVTMEAIKVADGNTALASDTSDPLIAVGIIGLINRDIAEDNLGRAYTADEIAGFNLAGSKLHLTTT